MRWRFALMDKCSKSRNHPGSTPSCSLETSHEVPVGPCVISRNTAQRPDRFPA